MPFLQRRLLVEALPQVAQVCTLEVGISRQTVSALVPGQVVGSSVLQVHAVVPKGVRWHDCAPLPVAAVLQTLSAPEGPSPEASGSMHSGPLQATTCGAH